MSQASKFPQWYLYFTMVLTWFSHGTTDPKQTIKQWKSSLQPLKWEKWQKVRSSTCVVLQTLQKTNAKYILHAQVNTQLTSPSTKNSSNRCSAKHANQIPKYKKTRETDTGQTQNWHPQVQKTQVTDTSQTENWHPQVPKVQVTNAGPKKITIYK